MRQSVFLLCLLNGLALGLSPAARAVPVFLKPESRFATGNQARSQLETRTHKVQLQRWFRVKTKDKVYGWIAEDHALTALKLVEQATLKENVPSRTLPDVEAVLGRPMIAAGTPVMILEIEGSWARVQPLTEVEMPQAWIPNEKLVPNFSSNIAQRAFVYQTTPLRVDAEGKSRSIAKVEEGTYVQLVHSQGAWLEIRSGRYQGYVAKSDVWTAADLGEKGVRAAVSLAPFRKQPLPYSELIRSLPFSATLTLITTSILKWGLASTHEQGEVWWPMNDETGLAKDGGPKDLAATAVSNVTSAGRGPVAAPKGDQITAPKGDQITAPKGDQITTAQLFSRKIYDMATSRAIPSLKFVSATGIFRTMDGETWTKIPLFRDQNYPIAVSKSGSIFIGPYVSDDHGETFQQWIRWDALLSALEKQHDVSAQNLKILEIHPEDSTGHKISLRLNVGLNEPIQVATDDQGVSWRSQ